MAHDAWNDSLFDEYLEPPPAYQLHSETSLWAATDIAPHAPSLREKCYDAIAHAPLGLTDAELERATGLGGSTVRPRRVELARANRIKKAGVRPTASGRQAQVWIVNG